MPVNLTVNQLLKFGEQLVQVGGGIRYWAESPDAGPEDWGLRLQLTLLFPEVTWTPLRRPPPPGGHDPGAVTLDPAVWRDQG